MKHRTPASRPSHRRPAGFTVVELLLTVFVIGTAFIAGTWSMTSTALTKAAYEKNGGPAPFLAREIVALADSLPRTPSGTVGATNGAAVVALDSLIGASFSPPIMADGSIIPGMDGWEQNVAITVFSLSNLAVPTAHDPADGLDPESALIYRLEVTIQHDGDPVDSFTFWVHP